MLLLVPLLGVFISCSGEKKQTGSSIESTSVQVQTMSDSTNDVDVIGNSDVELDQEQSEIDSLLNGI